MDNIDVHPFPKAWDGAPESVFVVDYNNGFALMLFCQKSGFMTKLMKLDEPDEKWSSCEDARRMHHSFKDALLWIVKWYYYT